MVVFHKPVLLWKTCGFIDELDFMDESINLRVPFFLCRKWIDTHHTRIDAPIVYIFALMIHCQYEFAMLLGSAYIAGSMKHTCRGLDHKKRRKVTTYDDVKVQKKQPLVWKPQHLDFGEDIDVPCDFCTIRCMDQTSRQHMGPNLCQCVTCPTVVKPIAGAMTGDK
jgi:hypothetical protein